MNSETGDVYSIGKKNLLLLSGEDCALEKHSATQICFLPGILQPRAAPSMLRTRIAIPALADFPGAGYYGWKGNWQLP
jgi:hypothetical protein